MTAKSVLFASLIAFSTSAAQSDALSVVLAGHVMLGRMVNDALKTKPQSYPWGDTLPLFERADVAVVNLECVIGDGGVPWKKTSKVYHFRSDAKNVEALQAASIDFVSLANNHALDYGYFALRDILEILDHAGIRHAGAGQNTAEACQPVYMDVRGIRIAFLAFTDNEPAWASKDDYPGICYSRIDLNDPRAQRIIDRVRAAYQRSSLVIVSVHWGGNWGTQPPGEHMRLGHALIDAGAGVVFGHSAHVFRGVEIYRLSPIIYSAGDFVDDYAIDPKQRNDQSFLFDLDVTTDGAREMRLYPTVIEMFQARMARGGPAEQIVKRMQSLSASLKTTSEWDAGENCLRIRVR